MSILVYADDGVSPFSLQETLATFRKLFPHDQVKSVTRDLVCDQPWQEETTLFIIPGGRDVPYDRNLRGVGTKQIRHFVENGGAFIGICAGAYFASREVIFEKGTSLEVHETRELQFFPGAAIGTVFPSHRFEYGTERGAHAAPVQFEETLLPLYYNGGCYFSQAASHPVKVLGTYQEGEAAVISCKVGKGKALLSGVHFEVRPDALVKENSPSDVCKTLIQTEERRLALLQTFLRELNLSKG